MTIFFILALWKRQHLVRIARVYDVLIVAPCFLSVFTIQTLWYAIFVQMINPLPPFSPFGTLIFVRLRDVNWKEFFLDFSFGMGQSIAVRL